jgi:transcriptional regulator with XRE-family HTH domain
MIEKQKTHNAKKSDANSITNKLKKLLFEHDLTPTELGRRLQDVPQQTIQRIVKGKIKKPHKKTLQIIADYFGLSLGDFYEESPQIMLFSEDLIKKNNESKLIDVYEWESLTLLFNENSLPIKSIRQLMIMSGYHDDTFGAIMPDSSMSPYFPKDSILIIEPFQKFEDRSFVLVHLVQTKKFLFRQLLSDGESYFLKALSSDLANFPIRKLDSNDRIIGKLVETRQTHFSGLGLE